MTLVTSFNLLGVGFEVDPLTGLEIDTGLVEVEVSSAGSTSVELLGTELASVDLATGTAVDVLGSELFNVDLTDGVVVDVADEVVGVDITEGIASVEVAGIGEEILFADISEGVGINTDSLVEFAIEIPSILDI